MDFAFGVYLPADRGRRRKQLLERGLLENADADDLQNFVQGFLDS